MLGGHDGMGENRPNPKTPLTTAITKGGAGWKGKGKAIMERLVCPPTR